MKNVVMAAVAAMGLMTTSAYAVELGGGVAAGGEVETTYNFDTETFGVLFTPEMSYDWNNTVLFEVSTEIDILELNNDAVDNWTGLDFEVTYTLNNNLELFGEISTNEDFNFGDPIIGSRLSF